jgi:hypothetical protein
MSRFYRHLHGVSEADAEGLPGAGPLRHHGAITQAEALQFLKEVEAIGGALVAVPHVSRSVLALGATISPAMVGASVVSDTCSGEETCTDEMTCSRTMNCSGDYTCTDVDTCGEQACSNAVCEDSNTCSQQMVCGGDGLGQMTCNDKGSCARVYDREPCGAAFFGRIPSLCAIDLLPNGCGSTTDPNRRLTVVM